MESISSDFICCSDSAIVVESAVMENVMDRLLPRAGVLGSTTTNEGYRNPSSSKRWRHEETLALLKIRSDMDVVFQESSVKSALWEVVSRKLAELGYNRCAKKCREKFDNLSKYHKRTKDGRDAKIAGKTYRFSDELEALRYHSPLQTQVVTITHTNPMGISQFTIPSFSPSNITTHDFININNSNSSSSSSSGGESEGNCKRKRTLSEFFKNLMEEVNKKHEFLQKNFLKTLERRENERIAKEEAWMQEKMIIKKKYDILMQERLALIAREKAMVEMLINIPEQSNLKKFDESSQFLDRVVSILKLQNGDHQVPRSSSRWPKVEVNLLIELRAKIGRSYQENLGKGYLWEEISTAMKDLGYNRSAKRCKEKWENINKYFKRMKENNKSKPEDSKTCPYFHKLDALYNERVKKIDCSLIPSYGLKAEDLVRHNTSRTDKQQTYPQHAQQKLSGSNHDDRNEEGQTEYGGIGHEMVTNKELVVSIVS